MSLINQFHKLCICGHLEMAQQLFLNNTNKLIGIEIKINDIFAVTCYYGQLEVAQWLYSIIPSINVSVDDEFPFRSACEHGHLKVAQWLHSIKPTLNVSTEKEYAFRRACRNGHLDIAQWLLEIQPTIKVSDNYVHHYFGLKVRQWLYYIKPLTCLLLFFEYFFSEVNVHILF